MAFCAQDVGEWGPCLRPGHTRWRVWTQRLAQALRTLKPQEAGG